MEGGASLAKTRKSATWGPTDENSPDAPPPVATPAPQYKVGDVVNGHVLTPQLVWEPIPPASHDPKTGRWANGNHGKQNGSKHRVSIAIENMLVTEAGALTRKCIDLALAGDPYAMKIAMDRIYPVPKGRRLPKLRRKAKEGSVETILRAVLEGEITPEEGKTVVSLIEGAVQAEMRRRELDLMKQQASKDGAIPQGGIMFVPVVGDGNVDDWEAAAIEAQKLLKAKVKE